MNSTPIVTVCAWCYPGFSAVEVHPELKGQRLSHGMCKHHFQEVCLETGLGRIVCEDATPGIICKEF